MNQANGSFHRREGRHRDFLERIEEIRKYFMMIIRWHFNGAFMACHRLHLVHYDCGNSDGITVLSGVRHLLCALMEENNVARTTVLCYT